MGYNVHYDVAAVIIAVTTLVHFLNKKSIKTPQTMIFTGLLWLSLLSAVVDIFTVAVELINPPVWLGYVGNQVYLLIFNTLPFVYCLYLLSIIKGKNEWNMRDKVIMWFPILFVYTMVLTTPFTKLVFVYDDINGYKHESCFVALYIIAFFYMLVSLYVSVKYRCQLTYGQRVSIYFYNIACLASIVMQVFCPKVLVLQFVVSIALLLAYLSLENPRDEEDSQLGIYNRLGFIKRVKSAIDQNREFHILGLNLMGYQSVRETLGVENSQLLLKQIVDTLLPKIRPMEMFSISQGQFILFTDSRTLDLNSVIEVIQNEFQNTVTFQKVEIMVGAYMYQLDYPVDVLTLEDIMDVIDYLAESVPGTYDGVLMHASDEILWKKRRENRIEQILQYAVREKNFDVYYQPIYYVAENRYNSAEALIRLRDEELGFISPEEFIPLAEKNGLIIEIGEQIFRTVCSMISREKLWEKGIEYIEVNLSVVQCMQEKLHERLLSIMDEYGLPYECINLEITETATVISKETLWQNMEQLIARGITFSLDDYGTGYSNMSNVIKYPFHIIKIDKSMVWSAMEDERAMRALKHNVAMIKDLDMHIVAEGAETKEQVRCLSDMGCDYIQGYYYSKPIPEMEFLSIIG